MKTKITCNIAMLCAAVLLSSCYNVRIRTNQGIPEPGYHTEEEDAFYRGKNVQILDTVIKTKLLNDNMLTLSTCASGAFYAIEYKNSFGNALHHFLTLGTRKKITIKYICIETQN
jgi:hypothetical protein